MNKKQFPNSKNKLQEILKEYKMRILDLSDESERVELLQQLKMGYRESPLFIREIVSKELDINFEK